MRAVLRTLCCGLAVSALILTASAQEPVKLVRLNVVAVDAQGKPVGDLTASDFHIVDEGKPETIALFHAGGFGPATAAHPGEFTNRPSPPPHTTVILFDCMNHLRSEWCMPPRSSARPSNRCEDASSIYFYVLTTAGQIDPIHPFPSAPGAAPDKTWNQGIEAMLTKEIKGMKTRPTGMTDEDVTKKTYVALETLGKQLANFPGRRDIIWVLGGVPWTYKENTKNPCNGIWVGCGLYAEHLSCHTWMPTGTVVNLLTYTDLDTNKTADMEAMAQLTGGSLTYGNKGGEINQVIQQLNESASAGYVIAYDPSSGQWDKKFHLVKIACDRKGVKLIAKTRYYALPDSRPPTRGRWTLCAPPSRPLRSIRHRPASHDRARQNPGYGQGRSCGRPVGPDAAGKRRQVYRPVDRAGVPAERWRAGGRSQWTPSGIPNSPRSSTTPI
jgi:hypothetical protein